MGFWSVFVFLNWRRNDCEKTYFTFNRSSIIKKLTRFKYFVVQIQLNGKEGKPWNSTVAVVNSYLHHKNKKEHEKTRLHTRAAELRNERLLLEEKAKLLNESIAVSNTILFVSFIHLRDCVCKSSVGYIIHGIASLIIQIQMHDGTEGGISLWTYRRGYPPWPFRQLRFIELAYCYVLCSMSNQHIWLSL